MFFYVIIIHIYNIMEVYMKLRIFLIIVGLIFILFSNSIFNIFYSSVIELIDESFTIIKNISIIIIGLLLSLVGLFFPYIKIKNH